VQVPDLLPFDRLQGIARADTPEMEKEYSTQFRLVRSALFQLDTDGMLVSRWPRRLREIPDFNFVLGESGVTWLLRLRPSRHRISRPCPAASLQAEAERLFRRQGFVTYQQTST